MEIYQLFCMSKIDFGFALSFVFHITTDQCKPFFVFKKMAETVAFTFITISYKNLTF